VLALGASMLDVAIVHTQIFMLFYWSCVLALLTIHLDRWLWPSTVACFACFLVAAGHPHLRFYLMAAGNLGFAINAFARWSPATLRSTAEERAERDARDARARRRRHRQRG